jgi:hypothetical protein
MEQAAMPSLFDAFVERQSKKEKSSERTPSTPAARRCKRTFFKRQDWREMKREQFPCCA